MVKTNLLTKKRRFVKERLEGVILTYNDQKSPLLSHEEEAQERIKKMVLL